MTDTAVSPEDIVAARPDISLETVRRECRAGRVPGAQKIGRQWFIPEAAAEKFCAEFELHKRKAN